MEGPTERIHKMPGRTSISNNGLKRNRPTIFLSTTLAMIAIATIATVSAFSVTTLRSTKPYSQQWKRTLLAAEHSSESSSSATPLFDVDLIDPSAVQFQMDDGSDGEDDSEETNAAFADYSEEEENFWNEDNPTPDVTVERNILSYLSDDDDCLIEEDENCGEFTRDEDDMLTEREDRLYVDADGMRRKVETCVLVGVEDLSAARKERKKARQRASSAEPYPEEQIESMFSLDESMTEMRELIKTAGMDLVGEVTQRLSEPNPKTYIGTGKVLECLELLEQKKSCTIVFDAELSPGQQKALENAFNKKVIQNDFMGSEQEVSYYSFFPSFDYVIFENSYCSFMVGRVCTLFLCTDN
uniref:GTPase HflX N-terminal domain-containing protein n=1 Tax=Ditylum brightwellii TaxID=49249 RepID=A0A7S4WA30_9STRA|mmetsp:Transcript_19614/g.28542  ORF Transcript_19614/g.28542 Transcript_19614/m.28542 type:complete len:356 (+) Transcript_19614:342-1409(+)